MKTLISSLSNFFENSKFSKYFFLLILIALFSRGIPSISSIYLIVPIFLLFSSLLGIKYLKNEKNFRTFFVLILLFTIWTLVTSFWSAYPIFTLKRGLYFFLISFGAFSLGYILSKEIRINILYPFLIVNVFIVSSSLISIIINYPDNAWTGGNGFGFMGFTNHQNKLGQDIYLSAAPLILFIKNDLKKIFKYLLFVLIIINLVLLFFTVSRASIILLFITWLIFLSVKMPTKKVLVYSSLYFLIGFGSIIIVKTTHLKDSLSITKNETYFGLNRETTIKYSFNAALNGGIFGLGYGISDERFIDPELGNFDIEKEGLIYRREKTISLLAIIEEVGIVGLIIFLSIILYPFKLLFNIKEEKSPLKNNLHTFENEIFILIFTFLLTLNFYGQIESWWIGIGSSVYPIYFILSGIIIRYLSNKKA